MTIRPHAPIATQGPRRRTLTLARRAVVAVALTRLAADDALRAELHAEQQAPIEGFDLPVMGVFAPLANTSVAG